MSEVLNLIFYVFDVMFFKFRDRVFPVHLNPSVIHGLVWV